MEEVVEHSDLFAVFETAYSKFVAWVKENAHLLQDKQAIASVVKGVDRDPALAIIVLQSKLASAEVRAAIAARDEVFFRKAISGTFDSAHLVFPDTVVAKGFQFAEVFVQIIDEIQST